MQRNQKKRQIRKKLIPSFIQESLQCIVCFNKYNNTQFAPMIICRQQHVCCYKCLKDLKRVQRGCPECRGQIFAHPEKSRYIGNIIDGINRRQHNSQNPRQVSQQQFTEKQKKKYIQKNHQKDYQQQEKQQILVPTFNQPQTITNRQQQAKNYQVLNKSSVQINHNIENINNPNLNANPNIINNRIEEQVEVEVEVESCSQKILLKKYWMLYFYIIIFQTFNFIIQVRILLIWKYCYEIDASFMSSLAWFWISIFWDIISVLLTIILIITRVFCCNYKLLFRRIILILIASQILRNIWSLTSFFLEVCTDLAGYFILGLKIQVFISLFLFILGMKRRNQNQRRN